jgi:hypothetical protein
MDRHTVCCLYAGRDEGSVAEGSRISAIVPAHPDRHTVNDWPYRQSLWKPRVVALAENAGRNFNKFDRAGCFHAIWCNEPKFAARCSDSQMGKPRTEGAVVANIRAVSLVN